jgi:trans-aconitate 2-methyltransferase
MTTGGSRNLDTPVKAEAGPAEWDAPTYNSISDPQFQWGQRVLARLPLRGDETLLDAGCGTGRLTAELLDRLPGGRVLAADLSQNMLQEARRNLSPRFAGRVFFLCADLQALPLAEAVDAIFSTATFHWIPDHPGLFRSLYRALKPGGRLVAQCGGGPNIARLLRRFAALAAAPPYAPFFEGWRGPWEFAGAEETVGRLEAAGFVDIRTGTEPAPTVLSSACQYRVFIATVIFRAHLERLPDPSLRAGLLGALAEAAARDDPPFQIDYWRLNIDARRPVCC